MLTPSGAEALKKKKGKKRRLGTPLSLQHGYVHTLHSVQWTPLIELHQTKTVTASPGWTHAPGATDAQTKCLTVPRTSPNLLLQRVQEAVAGQVRLAAVSAGPDEVGPATSVRRNKRRPL